MALSHRDKSLAAIAVTCRARGGVVAKEWRLVKNAMFSPSVPSILQLCPKLSAFGSPSNQKGLCLLMNFFDAQRELSQRRLA